MYTKTFDRNGTTVSYAELVSPRQLRDLAKAHGMTGAEARRIAQDGWGLHSMASKEMLDAIADGQTRTEMQLMALRQVEGNFGILVYQVDEHQYRFVLPLSESTSRELLSTLARQNITITWHPVEGGATRKTRHQLPSERVSPVIDLCQEELATSVEVTARMLSTALASLTSREYVPSLIDGVGVKAVYVAIVYEKDSLEVIADSLV
jgi:hypothetical protein